MDSVIANLWHEQVAITEVTALQKKVGDERLLPKEPVKFGKYTFAKDAHVFKTTYKDAIDNRYISTPTARNLAQFEEIGFKFTDVTFMWRLVPHTTYDWTFPPGQAPVAKKTTRIVTGPLTTAVYGTTPDNKKLVYVRKGGQLSPPIIYFEKEKGAANDVYVQYQGSNTNISPDEILRAIVRGKYKQNEDGTYNVTGDVSIATNTRAGYKNLNLTDIPVKFKNVSGDFYVHIPTFDITKLPDTAREINISVPSNLTSLQGFPTTNAESITLLIPATHNLQNFKGLPPAHTTGLNIRFVGTPVSSFVGCPKSVDYFELTGGGVGTSILKSFVGMPAVKQSLSVSWFNITSFTGLGHIGENLNLTHCMTTNDALIRDDVVSKVTKDISLYATDIPEGEIIKDGPNRGKLNKEWYATAGKRMWDKMKKASQDTGIDLDI